MSLLIAHPGTQHAPYLAKEMDRRGRLSEYRTCLAIRPHSLAAKALSVSLAIPRLKKFRNRIIRDVTDARIHSDISLEFSAHLRMLRGGNPVQVIHCRNEAFQKRIPKESIQKTSAVIGFDTSSWILADRCASENRPLLLERTTDHPANWQDIQNRVHREYPDWQEPPQPRYAPLVAAETKEHEHAHRIIVGSSFVATSLENFGVDPSKIVVNAYGAEWDEFSTPFENKKADTNRPFRFLFAGNICARKGVPVLLEAWKSLAGKVKNSELWLVGSLAPHLKSLIPALDCLRVKDRVTRSEMAGLFRQVDALVLPSFSEGFGLVLVEAIAAGLPVITTSNTGGPDLHRCGAESMVSLVEAGSIEALADSMLRLFQDQSVKIDSTSILPKLRSTFSWSAYGDRWTKLLDDLSL